MTELHAVLPTSVAPYRANLMAVRDDLKAQFLERDDIIDGLLTALLARQHVMLLGPPGTAKSALASELSKAIVGSKHFYWLLTKFSTPEEVFGPVSLTALQQDRFKRLTAGKLPESHTAFIDEIFKANSAILNTMLTVTQERLFHNDGVAVPCPLITMIGASNEMPEGEELEALFDRFLVRYWISYLVEPAHLRALLVSGKPTSTATISLPDLELCRQAAEKVVVPDVVLDAIVTIKERTESQGYKSSDRRWKNLIQLLKAYAYLCGDDVVGEDHLEILADVLWREPKDRAQLASIIGTVGNPLNTKSNELMDAAKELVAQLVQPANLSDAQIKSDWVGKISLTDTRLTQMESELDDLIARNPKRNLRKVKATKEVIKKYRKGLMEKMLALHNLD